MGTHDRSGGAGRTSAWAARAVPAVIVAGFVVATFAVIVIGGRRVVDAADPPVGLIAVAAAVVAIAHEPVARGAGRLANEWFASAIPSAAAVERFGAAMVRHDRPDAALDEMAGVLAAALPATSVLVWLRTDRDLVPVAARPDPEDTPGPVDAAAPDATGRLRDVHGDVAVEIRHGGVLLGAITVATSRPLLASERRLLDDLAAAAAIVSRTASLRRGLRRRIELAEAHEERLRAARARTDAAQLAERRRLERDLHDTCQQRAVVLAGKLGLVADGAVTDPGEIEALLDELDDDVTRVAESIERAVAAPDRPAALDDGVAAALSAETADTTPPVELVDTTERRHPVRVEREVFACCLEAVQNAVKHAEATRIVVRLDEVDTHLRFEVTDDGIGFEPGVASGRGLANLGSRLDGLGGEVRILSGPGGTVVTGRVPIPAAEGSR